MLRRVVLIIAAGSAVATVLACGASNTTGPKAVLTSVVVRPITPAVFVGDTQAMTATGKDQTGATMIGLPAASWTSSDPTKATIDPSTGVATGVGGGSTTLTATIVSASVTHSGTQSLTVTMLSSTGSVAATPALLFSPMSVTVLRSGGTATITWNFQSVTHTVHFDSQPTGATVGDIPATTSASVSRIFTVAGTYAYHCLIHGADMYGVIIVR